MELITEIPSEISPPQMSDPVQTQQMDTDCSAPTRKRQKQDISALKPLRTSGRIRIKMDNAAAARASNFISSNDESTNSIVKKSSLSNSSNNNNNNNSNINTKSKRKQKQKVRTGDIVSDLNYIDIKKPNNNVLIMFDVSIRALLTNFTFSKLSPENQKILIECLPSVDRPSPPAAAQERIELKPSSINNEFFNRACIEWKERLSNGEFTNDFQTKLRAEHEREKSKIDPWKARNFEGIWGFKLSHCNSVNVGEIIEKSALEMKGIVEQGDFEIPEGFINEVWKNGGEALNTIRVETNMSSQSNSFSLSPPLESPQLPSISTTVPTPPEVVTSTQPFLAESPPSLHNPSDSSESISSDLPAIAISSADSTVVIDKDCALPSTSSSYTVDDEYSGDVANQVELSSDGSQLTPSPWEQEHDYLKNAIEPEPSGMDNDNEIIEEEIENEEMFLNDDDDDDSVRMIETDTDYNEVMNSFENSYGNMTSNFSPQETIRKPEIQYTSYPSTSNASNVLIKNFIHQEPLVVRQISNSGASGYNTVIMHKKQQHQTVKLAMHNSETFLVDDMVDYESNYKEDMQINIPKKVVAYPNHGKLNDKIIIEDSICLQQPHQSAVHGQTSNFRANGGAIQNLQNSIIVGNQNFTYVPKIGTKIDQSIDAARMIKNHETNNNQSQIKQRIIYEIASEPKVSYDQPLSYSTQTSQPEIFHQLIKHPNGTTTIYETTVPPQKKTTFIQRKKVDPYTIILTPISNSTQQQTMQSQPQKSILHIHPTTPIIQTNSSSVQFLANPTTYVKKQTVIHPNAITQKIQPKYTTVIRAPPATQNQSIITQVTPKIQKPIQKQKVIMSTSSLQHYRTFSSKTPTNHGPRKQLHPQHIVRTTPTNTIIDQPQHHQSTIMHHSTPTIIHHQIMQDTKNNQIPVILPNQNQNEQIIIPNQIQAPQQTVVINPQQTIGNIFVRQKRPQPVFQHQQPQQQPPQQQQQQLQHQQQQLQQQQQQLQQHQQLQQQQHQQLNGGTNSTVTTAVQIPVNSQQALLQRSRQLQNSKSPPGSVNLERSYQICQAVIQNSSNPNRQQLLNSQMKVTNLMAQPKKF